MRSHSLIGGLAGLALCSVAAGGTLPECTIDFEVACPDAAPVCGATFTGGNGCAFEFLLACYSSGLFSYKALPGVPLTITLSGDLNTLEVFFVHQTGASGTMRFFDAVAGGNEILPPLLTNGDCLVAMHPKQFRSFSTPVRRIEVTATGGPLDAVWIDDFRVNAPCPEDVNGDGVIDILDFISLIVCLGQFVSPGFCDTGQDINQDGVIDILDFISLITELGTLCP